ncbi:TetR/AcrR family transcriptional regulator [Shewanella youngdeokensis]|uniref:TetR/AcrR family transcriptional regulator n=1 Tax=Shewanella youngdeokensis TaxID=2999068 RepID=A0ABZ0JX82_9GAMM|nr:TetR/AcrR family transcriptional regulator [Shewanella sp. DAU334]
MDKKLTRTEIKHKAVINASIAEFKAKGFRATSMDDIAKRAAVSKRTVYNHFASKEVLFGAIMQEMLAMMRAFEDVPFCASSSLESQLTLLARHEVTMLQAEGMISTSKVIIAEAIHSPELIADAMEQMSKQESPMASWFDAAIAAGAIKAKSSEMLVTQFTAVIKAHCFWPQLIQNAPFPDDAKTAEIVDTAVEMIIKQYGV